MNDCALGQGVLDLGRRGTLQFVCLEHIGQIPAIRFNAKKASLQVFLGPSFIFEFDGHCGTTCHDIDCPIY